MLRVLLKQRAIRNPETSKKSAIELVEDFGCKRSLVEALLERKDLTDEERKNYKQYISDLNQIPISTFPASAA
jgi:uncharacterized tellurite resistance protein B-like protein